MPIIKSAKKKLRKDVKRTKRNLKYKDAIKKAIKAVQQKKGDQLLIKKAYSIIDKAAKEKIIHKNKAARLKSKISKLVSKTTKTK